MAGMSTYPFKCDLCGGVTELAPTYGDFKCQHCGQVYVYDECHFIKLSERQLQTLRDSRWIAVSERLPEEDRLVLWYRPDERWPVTSGRFERPHHVDEGGDLCVPFSEGRYTHWMPLPEPPAP
jgi:predicted RNA-binding Zn-ribbon protein involved in translation (DUF1610 family)